MSLQRELDWRILEAQNQDTAKRRAFSSVRESRYTSDLHIWYGTLSEVRVGEVVGAARLQSGTKTRLRASVNRELRRAHAS